MTNQDLPSITINLLFQLLHFSIVILIPAKIFYKKSTISTPIIDHKILVPYLKNIRVYFMPQLHADLF